MWLQKTGKTTCGSKYTECLVTNPEAMWKDNNNQKKKQTHKKTKGSNVLNDQKLFESCLEEVLSSSCFATKEVFQECLRQHIKD